MTLIKKIFSTFINKNKNIKNIYSENIELKFNICLNRRNIGFVFYAKYQLIGFLKVVFMLL